MGCNIVSLSKAILAALLALPMVATSAAAQTQPDQTSVYRFQLPSPILFTNPDNGGETGNGGGDGEGGGNSGPPGGIGGNNQPVEIKLDTGGFNPYPTVGDPVSARFLVLGGTPQYTVTATPTSTLPFAFTPGRTVDNHFDVDSYYTQSGVFTFGFRATDSAAVAAQDDTDANFTVQVSQPLDITYDAASYTFRLNSPGSIPAPSLSGGRGERAIAVESGSLPAGFTLAADGSLAGTPTATGQQSVTILATDIDNRQDRAGLTLKVEPEPSISGLASGYTGVLATPFSSITPTATGTIGSVTWSRLGTWPTGISVSAANGAISGTPTVGGSFPNLHLRVTDSLGAAVSNAFSITIANEIVAHVTGNVQNLALPGAYFSAAEWTSSTPKRLVIDTGVVVHSQANGTPALHSGTGHNGSLTIEVHGSVFGAGSAGGIFSSGSGANGAPGGTAIYIAGAGVSVENYGSIAGGGGGGGSGGEGGDGQTGAVSGGYTAETYTASPSTYCRYSSTETYKYQIYYAGTRHFKSTTAWASPQFSEDGAHAFICGATQQSGNPTFYKVKRAAAVTVTTNGGLAGNGGKGAGYQSPSAVGTSGSAGGTGAGAGGTGGSGGALGSAGNNGSIGANGNHPGTGYGYSAGTGGLAGYAIQSTSAYGYSGTGSRLGRNS